MTSGELVTYFTAERQGGFLLVAMALAGFGLAAFLWSARHAFSAMAWPLLILGAFQIVIGLTVALRTPSQVAGLEQGFQASPTATAAAEQTRMARANDNFRIIKIIEVVLIAVGVALVMLFPHPGTWPAVGLGLVIESAALLAFDSFAHHRALIYTQWLASGATG